jgi:hypothetical protein
MNEIENTKQSTVWNFNTEMFIYLFIYLTLPINIKTQKNTYMDNGREHATAYANYSGPYI